MADLENKQINKKDGKKNPKINAPVDWVRDQTLSGYGIQSPKSNVTPSIDVDMVWKKDGSSAPKINEGVITTTQTLEVK